MLLLKVALFFVVAVVAVLGHPQWRTVECTTPDGGVRAGNVSARCRLIIKDSERETPGRPAPEGAGCFPETVNGEERIYCDLVCPESFAVFVDHIDQAHRACFRFYTYGIEKRDNDYFVWRSGKCINSTFNALIGCKFNQPFNEIVPNDNAIFARLRARALKAA